MQSAQKHINIKTICIQVSNFFCDLNYFLAQNSPAQPKRLIFLLFLFFGLFSFAQEENTTFFYINPTTTIVGLDCISLKAKLPKLENKQASLYVVKHTIIYGTTDIATIKIEDNSRFCGTITNNKKIVSKLKVIENKKDVAPFQNKTQVTQTPFPFSLPIEQKQTTVTAISTTTVTPSTFSKTINKIFAVYDGFEFVFCKKSYQKQNTSCYNQKSKPFQVKTKYCNRPPPVLIC